MTAKPEGGGGDNILAFDDGTERWDENAKTAGSADGRDEVNDGLVADVQYVWIDDWKPEVTGWGMTAEVERFCPNKMDEVPIAVMELSQMVVMTGLMHEEADQTTVMLM